MSTDIDPVWFPAMAGFAAGGDGPDVVTRVRNHLVHPQSPDELDRHPGLVQEVRLLQRRYLTLLVLHDIGYGGYVVDPADRTVMDLDARPVPWQAGSDQPPMPVADRDDPRPAATPVPFNSPLG